MRKLLRILPTTALLFLSQVGIVNAQGTVLGAEIGPEGVAGKVLGVTGSNTVGLAVLGLVVLTVASAVAIRLVSKKRAE